VTLNGPKGLSRRELTGCLSAFGLTVPTAIAMAARPSMAAAPSSGSAPNESERTVRFSEGTTLTEGFDAPDLKEAKALLEELAA
jgi:hypothetical protein